MMSLIIARAPRSTYLAAVARARYVALNGLMNNYNNTPQQPSGHATSPLADPSVNSGTTPHRTAQPEAFGAGDAESTPSASRDDRPVTRPEVKRSTAGSTWVALIVGALLMILLLVFIMQNQDSVQLHLFGWQATFPIGVGMLIAAIIGALIMALVGGVRIVQLRRQIRHAHD